MNPVAAYLAARISRYLYITFSPLGRPRLLEVYFFFWIEVASKSAQPLQKRAF